MSGHRSWLAGAVTLAVLAVPLGAGCGGSGETETAPEQSAAEAPLPVEADAAAEAASVGDASDCLEDAGFEVSDGSAPGGAEALILADGEEGQAEIAYFPTAQEALDFSLTGSESGVTYGVRGPAAYALRGDDPAVVTRAVLPCL